jgi:hypothetical protein
VDGVYHRVRTVTGRTMTGFRASVCGTERFDTPSVRSYPSRMLRQSRTSPRRPDVAAGPGEGSPEDPVRPPPDASAGPPAGTPSLAALGIAGVSRRRVAWIGLTVVAVVIVVGFAGQAADAARATTRVVEERAQNVVVAAQTEALRKELEMVTQERWVLQQARAYSLGSRAERPFALAPGAPDLADDAPGSPARRLGADTTQPSPLEGWLEVLFGPAPGG